MTSSPEHWSAVPSSGSARPVGVEEELLLVDPTTGVAVPAAEQVLRGRTDDGSDGPGGVVEHELQLEQVETATRPCTGLEELRRELLAQRRLAVDAAGRAGVAVVAVGASPLPVDPSPTRSARYGQMVRRFGRVGAEQLTCGTHVHVQVDSPEEGVAVLDRVRAWLPVLLAVSAGSPFHDGSDTGYASFRSQLQGRWPSSGASAPFGDLAGYRRTVDGMVATGTVLDTGMVYLDARLSERYPTVEVRVADVCADVDDAVLVAALARALVETAARAAAAGDPPDDTRAEVLRLASWRAARSGLEDQLVHPATGRPAPAARVLESLVDHVRDALDDAGDLDDVRGLVERLLDRGTSAVRQRSVHERSGDLADVVRDLVELTRAGT